MTTLTVLYEHMDNVNELATSLFNFGPNVLSLAMLQIHKQAANRRFVGLQIWSGGFPIHAPSRLGPKSHDNIRFLPVYTGLASSLMRYGNAT